MIDFQIRTNEHCYKEEESCISRQRGKEGETVIRVVKEGFSAEANLGQRPKYSEGVSHEEICGRSAPGRATDKCKGPESLPGTWRVAKRQEQSN